MSTEIQHDEILEFFTRLGERLTTATPLYLIGGTALNLLGNPRTTLDVDYVGNDVPPFEPLVLLIQEVASELQMEVEAVPIDGFIPLPVDSDKRHRMQGQYGLLSVYIFDPYTIALSKIDRGFESDLQDVRFLIQNRIIDLDLLENFVPDMLQQASTFLIDPIEFQNNWDSLKKLL